VKLLLDENLSHRIVQKIADLYPGSSHVKDCNLLNADDESVWKFAIQNGFAIVSKDSDFHQRSLLRGHPPKFIYLRDGNCSTTRITEILRRESQVIEDFASRKQESMLILM
jgi:predicted nuclease of predicted toxin-antitoxin system